jgi:putative acetyltransferase
MLTRRGTIASRSMESTAGFSIRRASHGDATEIIAAHVRSIREICSKDYSETQISAWSGRDFSEEIWRRTIDRDTVWVVEYDQHVAGFGHVRFKPARTATIEGLYFAPVAAGRGLGRELMSLVFKELTDRGVEEADLASTLTAKGFYVRLGFSVVRPTVVKFDGVEVECIEMRKHRPFETPSDGV